MSKNMLVELSDAIADAAENAGKSTVLVDARRRFPASGIAFSKDLILTADHVVEREEDIKVILADGTEVPARLAGRDPGTDLAVLKLDSASATPAEISKTPARVGQFVLAIGRPSTKGIESSFGTVNSIGGPIRTGRGSMLERYIKTDVVSYPGFSGGPLVNGDGTIFGINTSGFGNGGAITIPADIAWKRSRFVAHDSHASAVSSRKMPRPSSVEKDTTSELPAPAFALVAVGADQSAVAVRLIAPLLLGHCSAYCTCMSESARRRPSSALRRECTCAGG